MRAGETAVTKRGSLHTSSMFVKGDYFTEILFFSEYFLDYGGYPKEKKLLDFIFFSFSV